MTNILSWDQVAAVARTAGWGAGPAVYAVAITMPESSRDADAIQAGQPYATTGWGLWQITPGNSEPQFGIDNQLLDPINNGRAAYAKYTAAGGFGPWTTYENGLELPWLPDAEAAVARVYKLTKAQVQALAGTARTGGAPPAAPAGAPANWSVHIKRASAATRRSAAAKTAAATALTHLRGRFTPPHVPSPDPAEVLQHPERL